MSESKEYSTAYIAGFAVSVCFVCAIVVASTAVGLRERQETNQRIDRLEKVLGVAGLAKPGERLSAEEVLKRFESNVEAKAVDLRSDRHAPEMDPTAHNQRAAAKDPATSMAAPDNKARVFRLPHHAVVYHVKEGDALRRIILPIEGYGLWSTLYGYIALDQDLRTIRGIIFYEHGETPGLGGEVENPKWRALWDGRMAYGDGGDVRIEVIKGQAKSPDQDPYRVDGLSGATITSRGVSHLVQFWLGPDGFGPYLKWLRSGDAVTEASKPEQENKRHG